MKLYVGVTDKRWFDYLAAVQPDEVNFWKPGGNVAFRALEGGGPFLFKLHSPNNFIVGGGFFVGYSALPLSIAWETFREKNGMNTFSEFRRAIFDYRKREVTSEDPIIGCVVLTTPFFLPRERWIPVPADWSSNLVQGKSYSLNEMYGARLWTVVQAAIGATQNQNILAGRELPLVLETQERYGTQYLTRGRLGQGGFRVLVTEAYTRRCAITGEKTLPVLEAAHIRPYEENGPHKASNGLLLRADMHKLFDKGLVTVTPDYHVEVSPKIKEEWENGREYYKFHGNSLAVLPKAVHRPSAEFLQWHNEERFRG